MATFTGATAAVGCASGTDALWLALLAAGVQPGDAVITTAFSFFASASAIARVGARPVLVDVDRDTLNLDPESVKSRLRTGGSYKIRALLPVHLYGQCADMDRLQEIADEFRLPIIEDAAQAIGAKWRGRSTGSLGVASAFSFYPTKNLSAYGDAGLVTTRDLDFAEHMRSLRNHGSAVRYHHEEVGWNCRMDAIQAAILRVKLPHIETWNQQRRQCAENYDRLLADAGLVSKRNDSPIGPLQTSSHAFHVFHQYVIRVRRRDELRKFLSERKIGTEIYYPVPLHLQPCFAYLGYSARGLARVGTRCSRSARAPHVSGIDRSRAENRGGEYRGVLLAGSGELLECLRLSQDRRRPSLPVARGGRFPRINGEPLRHLALPDWVLCGRL